MKIKKLAKSVAAYACVGAMVVGSLSGVKMLPGITDVFAGEEVGDDIVLNDSGSPFIKTFNPGDGSNYAYMGYVYCGNVTSDYKYLKMTYSGDATALDEMRLELHDASDNVSGTFWFTENAAGTFKTIDDTLVPAPETEEKTVIIDLEKSGIDMSNGISAFHVHDMQGMGEVTISDARFMKTLEEPRDTSNDIILNGDDITGESSMIGTITSANDNYKYAGYATLKEANGSYKYLELTYTGNIIELRFEFNQMPDDNNDGPYWFNPDQEMHFVTKDGSDIPMIGDNTTIVIDLEASGVDFANFYSGIHMHCANLATNGDIVISNAVLYGGVKTEAETTTAPITQVETTTQKIIATTATPTTATPTKKVKAPSKAVVKSATKKKSAKKAVITIKKMSKVAGYQIKISTSKKFKAKVTKTLTKKTNKIVVKNLKKNKKYHVKARAYRQEKGSKVFGKWSKVRTVTFVK